MQTWATKRWVRNWQQQNSPLKSYLKSWKKKKMKNCWQPLYTFLAFLFIKTLQSKVLLVLIDAFLSKRLFWILSPRNFRKLLFFFWFSFTIFARALLSPLMSFLKTLIYTESSDISLIMRSIKRKLKGSLPFSKDFKNTFK